ncbi:phosphate/phosphite/phosphonate ABC transporter substrate-binding protein [Thiohalophilus sp.]|uniref:phosphate/phosphite/phosphonate ABC transporter substrate-binding protein n=1 Tax=Thiohalophilus sp. TaxID=3028392 RepID=UPI0039770B3C
MQYIPGVMLAIVILLAFQPAHAAEKPLIFSTAPTHSVEVTRQIYTPIVRYLSGKTGKKIILEPAKNFIEYSNKFKKDYYDFVFDGPHFVGWRMTKYRHTPLVSLSGKINIVVVSNKDITVKDYHDLIGHRVCTFASPNMLTMAFLEYYPNPARQPILITVKGFKALQQCLSHPGNYGAVLRDKMWNKIKDKKNIRIVLAPQRDYPERTISASSRVDTETRQKVIEALLHEDAKPHIHNLLETFKTNGIVAADPEEYEGLGLMLRHVWGFELP